MKNTSNGSHAGPKRTTGSWALRRLWLSAVLLLVLSATQAQMITGVVSDEKGTKLSNVSVIIKGSSQGTSTSGDGRFSIAAPGNAILVFSSVGYKSQEVSVSGRTVVNVLMVADDRNLAT